MKLSERPESTRLDALAEFVRTSVKPPTSAELAQGLAELRGRLGSERARAGSKRKRAILLVAATASLLVALVSPRLLTRPSVEKKPVAVAHIDGGKLLEGGYLAEVGSSGIQLVFNEGTKFALTAGTRGRLVSVNDEGARFVLDRGAASFRVTRNAERHWRVDAGPFAVSVQGTDFTVTWDPSSEQFEVALRDGRVSVTGPVLGEALVLRPGQNLSVNLSRGETRITEGNSAPRSEPKPAPPNAAAPSDSVPSVNTPAPARSAAAPTVAAAPGERRWRQALAKGDWDRILSDVAREGVDASLRTLSADELFVLSDAARYRRRADLARASLAAVRDRFPNSPRALDALFMLGRVEESRAGGKRIAIQRYDEYLARARGGTYAAEALGRKMILVKDLEGQAAARHIAEEYLRRFPSGSYAETAHVLQRGP